MIDLSGYVPVPPETVTFCELPTAIATAEGLNLMVDKLLSSVQDVNVIANTAQTINVANLNNLIVFISFFCFFMFYLCSMK